MAEDAKERAAPATDALRAEPAEDAGAITRRRLLLAAGGAATAALGVAVLYRGLARVTAPPWRIGPPLGGYPVGQYQIAAYGLRTQIDSGSEIDVPPVWNLAITATLARMPGSTEQRRLEAALAAVEAAYPYSPAGVFALVGYGLPYFRRYIPGDVFNTHLPRMADAGAAPVLLDAVRFAGDPPETLLEANDVVFHLRSDKLDQLHDVQRALFGHGGSLAGRPAPVADLSDLFHVTSVRTGFVGAGMPRRLARQAHLTVADRIPEAAPLFMGFTSAQTSGQAKDVAVSFDGQPDPLLAPLTTAQPDNYFAGGTALHLSHLIEDLDRWYTLSYAERVARMFHLEAPATPEVVTLQTSWLNPNPTEVDVQRNGVIGHNEAVQRGSRTPEGQALQLRVDFNTLDPLDVAGGTAPTPGVHFMAFTPGSQVFHRSRQGMDAADLAAQYGVAPAANGINSFIRATRRQNFLVPPRRHRAFPLLELQG